MHNFALSKLDIFIIIAETLLVVVVGLVAARRMEHTTRGYFLASGRMPWWLIGAAFVGTSVSSEQIVGTVGAAYKHGMGIANWEWWCLPTYVLLMIFFIPLYLKNRITTVPEFLSRRFGPVCGDVYSYVMLFGYVFVFLSPALYGGSVTFSQLTGWPVWVVLVGLATLIGLYTVIGGLGSVMWADAVQCSMLLVGGIVLFFLALHQIPGGWGAMIQAAPERFHLYHPPGDTEAPFLGLIAGTFGVFLFYQSTNQVMIQRVLSARSTWDGLMGIVFAGFINLLRPLVTCFLGLVIYHWIEVMHRASSLLPDQQDRVFPFAIGFFAPSGLRGVILAGFLAAIMGAASALANSVGTIFSLDVYRRFFQPAANDRRLILVGRVASGMALALACVASPMVAQIGIFKFVQTGVTYMATPFISVILLGIFWKRTNYPAALAGLIGGLIIQVGLVLLFWKMNFHLHWLYIGFIAQAITMGLVVVVTLLSRSVPPAAGAEAFHWDVGALIHLGGGEKRPWYKQVKVWLGLYALIWVWLYWRFW